MEYVGKNEDKLMLLEQQIPITEAKYNNKTVQTFYHCSKIIDEDENYTYKDQQIFVKNNELYLIDGKFNNLGNSVIIDSYNNKQFVATLGTDGVIYDILTKINYPLKFNNKNIIAMTNNISDDSNVVLVYYSSGKVYGFNYITGEEVYDNNVEEKIGLLEYIKDNLSVGNILYDMNNTDYKNAQKLADKLEKKSIDELNEELKNDEIEEFKSDKNDINIIINDSYENNGSIEKTNEDNSSNNRSIKDSNEINNNNSSTNNSTNYITTYDPVSKNYVVYNPKEILEMESYETISENAKISNSQQLMSYYGNVSKGKNVSVNFGNIIITMIVGTIIMIMIVMYRKANK